MRAVYEVKQEDLMGANPEPVVYEFPLTKCEPNFYLVPCSNEIYLRLIYRASLVEFAAEL